jgi:hypothetical protein
MQRASRALAAAAPVQPTPEVKEHLAILHPVAPVPDIPSSGGVFSQVTRAQLLEVITSLPQCLPLGQVGGLRAHRRHCLNKP